MKTPRIFFLILNFIVSTIAFSAATPVAYGADAQWTIRNKPRDTISIVLRRGELEPETGVIAPITIWARGCVPKVDARLTLDGDIVASQDQNSSRIFNDAKKDDRLNIAPIEEFVELLKEDPRRRVVIEPREVDLQKLADAIHDVRFQVTIMTDREDLLADWSEICPNADGTLRIRLRDMDEERLEARFNALREKNFRGVNRVSLNVTRKGDGSLFPSAAFIRSHGDELRRRGIEFLAAPRADSEETTYALCRELLELNAMGFETNRVDVAIKALDDFYAESPVDWNIRENIPLDEVIVMGHRGMGSEQPEGTLETFRSAWASGVAPEADIRMTKDGVFVSFHDNNFARIIPDAPDEIKKLGVKDVTLEGLLELDVGAYMGEEYKGQRAATLADIVAELKEDRQRLIFCDIKDVDLQ